MGLSREHSTTELPRQIPEKWPCLTPSFNRLQACTTSDPCCFVEPVFRNGCFHGCDVKCRNSAFCERACPVLSLDTETMKQCINRDPHCFVQKLTEVNLMNGKQCFSGCVKACL
ncbi:uncharacterized protein LOC125683867 isoform X2 [Ostrea edulis]|uniref:uncharacterized protein LOC125683867 isoform X2 n=1 Tax=Ostrea edulis TaxID=37623 RepID=UPI0024AFB26D|nr:uncharacterized protein LOC125683867 isoform X2 [Ostrea edulis]